MVEGGRFRGFVVPGGLIVTRELGENGGVEGGPLWVEVEVCGSKLHWVNDQILPVVPPPSWSPPSQDRGNHNLTIVA